LHSRKLKRTWGILHYSKEYAHCLIKKDLSELQKLSDGKRPHVLKALSSLAKFLGVHQEYRMLIKSYGLKWAGRSKDDLIIDRLTKVEDPGEIFNWIQKAKKARPELTEFLDFMAVTGLRLIEAVNSYNLIIELSREGKLDDYYNAEKGTLEHYKFKETFIRRNKKAFISFVPGSIVKTISENETLPTTQAVIKRVQKQGLESRFGDVREAHGTFMTKFLKQPEIDFLHGRVSANVFMSNYFNPALIGDLKTRAFQGIKEMQAKI